MGSHPGNRAHTVECRSERAASGASPPRSDTWVGSSVGAIAPHITKGEQHMSTNTVDIFAALGVEQRKRGPKQGSTNARSTKQQDAISALAGKAQQVGDKVAFVVLATDLTAPNNGEQVTQTTLRKQVRAFAETHGWEMTSVAQDDTGGYLLVKDAPKQAATRKRAAKK